MTLCTVESRAGPGLSRVTTKAAPDSAAGIKVLVLGCLVQVGNDIELDTVGRQFDPYRWRPCGVSGSSSSSVAAPAN